MRLMSYDAVQGFAFGVSNDAFVALVLKCIVLVRELRGARWRPRVPNAITATPAVCSYLHKNSSSINGLSCWDAQLVCVMCRLRSTWPS